MIEITPEESELRPFTSQREPVANPDELIPGYRVTYGELDRACEYLRGQGWSGLLRFDEAVRSLVSR